MKTSYKLKKEGTLLEVPMDEAGSRANEYLDCAGEIADLNERKDELGAQLVNALRAAGRASITLRGTTLTIKEIEAKVKIVSKKERE